MNYENQTKRQLIKECKRLKRMINKKENNYVLLEKDLDCLQQSIANYVEIVLHQRKEIERLNNILEEFEEELEREIDIKEEDTGLEHDRYLLIKDTLETMLRRFRNIKGSDKE